MWILPRYASSVASAATRTWPTSPPPESSCQGWRVEEEFISAIRGHEKIKFTTFEDGVKYMEFTDAVAISSMTGQAVELPLGNTLQVSHEA